MFVNPKKKILVALESEKKDVITWMNNVIKDIKGWTIKFDDSDDAGMHLRKSLRKLSKPEGE